MDLRFFLPCFHGPRASHVGHKRKEKTWSITCRRALHSANKKYVLSLSARLDQDLDVTWTKCTDSAFGKDLPNFNHPNCPRMISL